MTDDEKIAHIRSQLADRANAGDMLAEDARWAIGKLQAERGRTSLTIVGELEDEIVRLREALVKLLEYEPYDRSEFRSDAKGDRQFRRAKDDYEAARAAIRNGGKITPFRRERQP